MQPLFNLAHQPHGNDNGDNVALVADQRNFVQSAKHRLVGLHALRSNGPGVLQVGVNRPVMPMTAPRNWLPPNTFAAENAIRIGRKVYAVLENSWANT